MAFLDNSGDIILDAVLTETGRRRMAQGDFRITKFALGDDEIDYSLYDKTHPSGSAYYDLTILQTPIFEAFTQVNAGINYGLLPNTATDLLYLPTMKTNELAGIGTGIARKGSSPASSLFYLTDTSKDTTSLNIGSVLRASGSTDNLNGTSTGRYVLLETGLDTGFGNVPVGSSTNRTSYLTNNNLIDRFFYVFYDSRFIGSVLGSSGVDNVFNNTADNNGLNISFTLDSAPATSISIGLENYAAARVNVIPNGVVYTSDSNNTEETYSAIGGPRGVAGAVAFTVKAGLDPEYTLYGSVNQSFGSNTIDYIDTTVYVQGGTTGAQIQIPVRIARIS